MQRAKPKNQCPHCQAKAIVSSSRSLSLISRETYFQCTNIECGHTWASITTAVRSIVPSRTPNPDVHIPISERAIAMNTLLKPG